MTTDLETVLRDALKTRGDAVTPATLRRPSPVGYPVVAESAILRGPSLVGSDARVNRSRRANAVWLSAAVLIAALVSVVALVASASERGTSAGAGDGAGQLLRTLHFAINLPTGYTITRVASNADGSQDVQITAADNGTVELTVDPLTGADRHFRSDAQRTTIAGRPGFIGATWTDSQYDTNNSDLPDDVSWKYNDVAYAVLHLGYPPALPLTLIELASRIDFSKQTAIRVATSIGALPAGTHPAEILSTYREASDFVYPWDSTIILSLDSSSRDAIRIDLCRCGSSSAARIHAKTRIINGRTAYVYGSGAGGDVEIDFGGGVVLHVASSHSDEGQWTGTASQLLDVAAAVSVTSSPNEPGKWLDAATAIP